MNKNSFVIKCLSAIFAGFYIGIGVVAYYMIPDKLFGSIFFAVGILLVSFFFNMLFTRVSPLFPFKEYNVYDMVIAFVGNFIGAAICALLINSTRLKESILSNLIHTVEKKIGDNLLSQLIMAIFCAVLVGYAVIISKYYFDKKGIVIFMYVFLVAAFVVIGFDHVVANMFYYMFYSFNEGFKTEMISSFAVVGLGNIIGGFLVGYSEILRKKLSE